MPQFSIFPLHCEIEAKEKASITNSDANILTISAQTLPCLHTCPLITMFPDFPGRTLCSLQACLPPVGSRVHAHKPTCPAPTEPEALLICHSTSPKETAEGLEVGEVFVSAEPWARPKKESGYVTGDVPPTEMGDIPRRNVGII